MNRIAIVRTCAVGDAVQCTPLLQQLRADEPDAHLTFFTSANVVPLFDGARFVDEVIGMSSSILSNQAGRRGLVRAWWQIAMQEKFDAMISLEPTWMRNLGSMLVRSPIKAGLSFTDKRKPIELFTHPLRITGNSNATTTHASKQYLDLWLKLSGNVDRGFGYDMRHLIDDRDAEEPTICIAPGTGNAFVQQATKQWSAASFVELGELLIADGWRVSYLGGTGDLGEHRVPDGATNLLGKTSLREVANSLHRSAALVGNDSGLFHLAQGVGCPAIGIFGPTSPHFTGAFRSTSAITLQADLPCMPCYRDTCSFVSDLPKPCCMSAVTVKQVLQATTNLARVLQLRTAN